ncbi:MFS transporter [Candidatus Woesebacteria bacterium]|nr:MFS transporter [Candidatus Woesebacteria bacterium]
MFSRFPALQVKAYRNIIFGIFISGVGSEMTRVAIAWQLYDMTGSKYLLGVLGFMGFFPILFGTQIAGVVTDRVDRRLVLGISNGLLALVTLIFTISVMIGFASPLLLLCFAAILSFLDSFGSVSKTSIFPSLLPSDLLPNAITINSAVMSMRKIVGPMIGGFMIALLPIHVVYSIDTLSFIVLALIASQTPKVIIANKSSHLSFIDSYKEGLRFVISSKLIVSTGIMDFLIMLFASAQTILPAVIQDVYHGDPIQLGLLYAAISIGSLIPGVYFSTLHKIRNYRKLLIGAVSLVGVCTVIFGLVPNFIIGFVALLFFGVGDEISSIIRNNIRQILTPEHMRARMTAVMSLFYIGGPRLGDFEAGMTAAWLGIQPSLVINGVLALVTTGVFHKYFAGMKKEFLDVENAPQNSPRH